MIGVLICQESIMDNICTCSKAEFEAKLNAKTIDTEIKSIKKYNRKYG